MKSQTSLAARNCRLQEWSQMVHSCNNRPIGMSVNEWCRENSITTANYYYRKKKCLSPAKQMVSVTRKFDRLNTPANRFVKFALHKFDSICVDLVQVLEADGQAMQAECIEEAKAIHKIIENIFRDSFFDVKKVPVPGKN